MLTEQPNSMPIFAKIGVWVLWLFTAIAVWVGLRPFHDKVLVAIMVPILAFQVFVNVSLQRRKPWAYTWTVMFPGIYILKFAIGIVTGNPTYSAPHSIVSVVITIAFLALFVAPKSVAWFRPFKGTSTKFVRSEPK